MTMRKALLVGSVAICGLLGFLSYWQNSAFSDPAKPAGRSGRYGHGQLRRLGIRLRPAR